MAENLNFHMTFPPTPAYLGRLLRVMDGTKRSSAEIAEMTGIPEGASTGKVKPHIDYAAHMGLIDKESYSLTALGKAVKSEDVTFSEKLTLLLCHSMLTSVTGASMWRFFFRELMAENPDGVSNQLLDDAMRSKYGENAKYRPVITTYTNQFTALNLLRSEGDRVSVVKIPFEQDMIYVYAYSLLHEWESIFPSEVEITAGEFSQLKFGRIFGWDDSTEYEVLQRLAAKGIVVVNSQLVPFTVKRVTTADAVIPKLYSLLF